MTLLPPAGSTSSGPMPQRFAAGRTLDGFEVVCTDTGRSLGFERETAREANGIAQSLNQAAMQGSRALARALRSA